MLNAATARDFVKRIERQRAEALAAEAAILDELRALPDYEINSDTAILDAVGQRADARETHDSAETLIRSFDWFYDEEAGENKLKPGVPHG